MAHHDFHVQGSQRPEEIVVIEESVTIVEEIIVDERRPRRLRLALKFRYKGISFQGENMIFTFGPINADGTPAFVPVSGVPVLADGVTASAAKLSGQAFVSSDPTVFTVAADPANPGGAIVTAVANPPAGTSLSATLTETATATEPDGSTTEVIQGTATVVIATPAVVPPPAAAILLQFGTPSNAPASAAIKAALKK